MAFLLSYAVESWAFHLTWQFYRSHSAYLFNTIAKKPNPPPQTNHRVISHPFKSSPNPSENHDGFNTVYSSLRTRARFTLNTCRTCSSHGIAQDGDALSTHAVAKLLMMKTQVDPELTGNSTHICMCSADCCYSYTVIFQLVFVQRVYKNSLPAYFSPIWNHFTEHTFTQRSYMVMPAVYCSE